MKQGMIFQAPAASSGYAYAIVRMITGMLLIYHGQELFHKTIMDNYLTWDIFKVPYGKWLVYTGKISELIAGLSLLLGFYTRVGALLCIGTMLFITFIVGNGRFWYEDQHPFLFVLIGTLFFFTGSGVWSLDGQKQRA